MVAVGAARLIGRAFASVGAVGYNPYRKRVRRTSDIWFVGITLAVTLALSLWAFLPR